MITPEIIVILIGIILVIVLGLFNMSNGTVKDERIQQQVCQEQSNSTGDNKKSNIVSNCSMIDDFKKILDSIPDDISKLTLLDFTKLHIPNDNIDDIINKDPNPYLYFYVLIKNHNITKKQISDVLYSLDVRNNTENFKDSFYKELIKLTDDEKIFNYNKLNAIKNPAFVNINM